MQQNLFFWRRELIIVLEQCKNRVFFHSSKVTDHVYLDSTVYTWTTSILKWRTRKEYVPALFIHWSSPEKEWEKDIQFWPIVFTFKDKKKFNFTYFWRGCANILSTSKNLFFDNSADASLQGHLGTKCRGNGIALPVPGCWPYLSFSEVPRQIKFGKKRGCANISGTTVLQFNKN